MKATDTWVNAYESALVFPCHPDKRPAVESWKSDARSPSQWGDSDAPLWGLIPHSIGASATDSDAKPGKPEGLDTLKALFGDRFDELFDTAKVETPSGGWHFFHLTDEALGNSNTFGAGVDVRCASGYVCLYGPPVGDPKPLPADLRKHMKLASESCAATGADEGRATTPLSAEELARDESIRPLAEQLARQFPPRSGTGRGTGIRLASLLLRGLRCSDVLATEVYGEIYNPRCTPPRSAKQIAHKISEGRAGEPIEFELWSPESVEKWLAKHDRFPDVKAPELEKEVIEFNPPGWRLAKAIQTAELERWKRKKSEELRVAKNLTPQYVSNLLDESMKLLRRTDSKGDALIAYREAHRLGKKIGRVAGARDAVTSVFKSVGWDEENVGRNFDEGAAAPDGVPVWPALWERHQTTDSKWPAAAVQSIVVEPLRQRFRRLPSGAHVELTPDNLAVPVRKASDALARAVAELLQERYGLPCGDYFATQRAADLKLALNVLDVDPMPVVFADQPDVLAWNRLDFVPTEGPHPAWDEFTKRCGPDGVQADEFKAWVWSIFDNENTGRRALWLNGRGKDGKSVVLKVIRSIFSNELIGLLSDSAVATEAARRFAMTSAWGARLIVYPECNRPEFPTTSTFKEIAANEILRVEGKGVDGFSVQLNARLAIASNPPPLFGGDAAATSRILVIRMQPSGVDNDPTWAGRLRDELPPFLFSCREAYERLCPDRGDPALSPFSEELIGQRAAEHEEDLETLSDLFEFSPDYKATAKAIGLALAGRFGRKLDKRSLSDLYDYWERTYSVTPYRTKTERGRQGIRVKAAAASAFKARAI